MPVTRRRDPAPARAATSASPEVDVGRRVAGRQAREGGDAAVHDLLVARRLRDARRVYTHARTHARTGHVTSM